MSDSRQCTANAPAQGPWPGLESVLVGAREKPSHVYAALIGSHLCRASAGEAIAALAAWPTARDGRGCFAVGAIASLADRALLNSVVQPAGDYLLYTTVTLTLKILDEPDPQGAVTAQARMRTSTPQIAGGFCTLLDGAGREFGTASGVFAVARRSSVGRFPSRAERSGNGQIDSATEEQRLAWETGIAGPLRPLGPSPSYRQLLRLQVAPDGEGLAEATIPIAPYLWNAAGYLHGAVVFGAAAEVAIALLDGWRVAEQHCQYLAAVVEGRLRLRARLLRRGRRVAFVAVDVATLENQAVASLLSTLVPAGG